MKNNTKTFIKVMGIALAFLLQFGFVQAQPTGAIRATNYDMPSYRIAVFAPLFLDSAFSGTTYRYGKVFPKFVLPGFDFVQGVQMAADSLKRNDIKLFIDIYDSKSTSRTVAQVINSGLLDSVDFILGPVKDAEYFQLAKFAAEHKVPFISATYPNDGGVKNDPYLIIQNTTLQSHCEGIFSHLLNKYGNQKILFVRKNTTRGDIVSDYFDQLNHQNNDTLLNFKTVVIGDDNNFSSIISHLDSTKQTIVVGASLNTQFVSGLVETLSALNKKYPTQIIGMPNWDAINFKAETLKEYGIVYTTPFYMSKWQGYSKTLAASYKAKYKGNPSDMVYKAYDITSYFLSVMLSYPGDIMKHINDGKVKIFTDPFYKPNFTSTGATTPDYYENKRIIFLRKQNGTITKAW